MQRFGRGECANPERVLKTAEHITRNCCCLGDSVTLSRSIGMCPKP